MCPLLYRQAPHFATFVGALDTTRTPSYPQPMLRAGSYRYSYVTTRATGRGWAHTR